MKRYSLVCALAVLLAAVSTEVDAQHPDFPAELQQFVDSQIPLGETALGSTCLLYTSPSPRDRG